MMVSRRRILGGLGAVTFGVAGFAGIKSMQSQPATAQGTLTPTQAQAAIKTGEIMLVDIRRPDEWQGTGIAEGAVPIDMRRDDFVDAVLAARPDPAMPIAFICARGVRSRRTLNVLLDAGVSNIIDIPEGMLGSRAGPGWIAAGLPMVAWTG